MPEGTLAARSFEPAGLLDRTPEEIYHAAFAPGSHPWQAALEGICGVCSSSIDASVDIRDDHDADGVCDECGRLPAVMAQFVCPVCKKWMGAPPYKLVTHHPAVIGSYYDRGISIQYDVDDFERLLRREILVADHHQTVVSRDPLRVEVTIRYAGDELHVTVDGRIEAIDVQESTPSDGPA